jgi:hypothetical protein
MKKTNKIIRLSLAALLGTGLLLSLVYNAQAAPETLTGLLTGTSAAWTVNGDPVVVDADGLSPTDTLC